MNFIKEIQSHPKFKDYCKQNPTMGMMYLSMFDKQAKIQFPIFAKERDRRRQYAAVNKVDGDFREVAIMPEVVAIWLRWLNNGEKPSQEVLRDYLKTHPEYLVTEKI